MENWPKVLIVDDDSQQRLLAAWMVKEVFPGAEIRTVADAVTAMKEVSDLKPHLVLTDIMMGETNGIELCRSIKSDPYYAKRVKVATMTGFDDDRLHQDALQFGADAYLTKPIEADTWRRGLSRLLPARGEPRKDGFSWVG